MTQGTGRRAWQADQADHPLCEQGLHQKADREKGADNISGKKSFSPARGPGRSRADPGDVVQGPVAQALHRNTIVACLFWKSHSYCPEGLTFGPDLNVQDGVHASRTARMLRSCSQAGLPGEHSGVIVQSDPLPIPSIRSASFLRVPPVQPDFHICSARCTAPVFLCPQTDVCA